MRCSIADEVQPSGSLSHGPTGRPGLELACATLDVDSQQFEDVLALRVLSVK